MKIKKKGLQESKVEQWASVSPLLLQKVCKVAASGLSRHVFILRGFHLILRLLSARCKAAVSSDLH